MILGRITSWDLCVDPVGAVVDVDDERIGADCADAAGAEEAPGQGETVPELAEESQRCYPELTFRNPAAMPVAGLIAYRLSPNRPTPTHSHLDDIDPLPDTRWS